MNVMELAAKRLASGRRTEKELYDHLLKKGADPREAAAVVASFREDGYLNDEFYCRDYFRIALEKGWGKQRAFRELENRGVRRDVIEEAWETYTEENPVSETDNAYRVIAKMAGAEDLDESGRLPDKLKAKLARRLYGYGYGTAVIYAAVDLLAEELYKERAEETGPEEE
ncbi:MAG: regulatory protein RecX [Eubacterium sp.]|nr:regulatory protein RecX [Eubacterium sp.]